MLSQSSILSKPACSGVSTGSCRRLWFRVPYHTPSPIVKLQSESRSHSSTMVGAAPSKLAAGINVTSISTKSAEVLSSSSANSGVETFKSAKRKVAVFVAYVGSAFRGLQVQRDQPGGTVEDVLQQAMYDVGAILPSNYGNLHKIGWTRSSRTDKGVHALANVVAMKLECNPESFTTDPEGSQLASTINEHLPAEVQVLSVQRVNSGFNARGFCNNRTYHYYLPTSLLGLTLDGGPEDSARMELLRQCCSMYQGNHPFHNYTKRRLYRTLETQSASGPPCAGISADAQQASDQIDAHGLSSLAPEGQQQKAEVQGSNGADDGAVSSHQEDESFDWEVVQSPEERKSDRTHSSTAPSTNAEMSEDTTSSTKSALWTWPRPLEYRWLDDMDPRDRLAPAHYRFIRSMSADDPMPLTPQGASAVKVSITGSSFMLHQIRHMIGAAAAVARGNLPLEFVSASLCAPARAILPLAPAQVLVLANNTFQPFPSDRKDGQGTIQKLSGTQLQLRAKGQAARDDFAQRVLHPAIEKLFEHEVWAQWDNDLKLTCWQDDEMEAFTAKSDKWRQQRAVISEEKQLRLRGRQQEKEQKA